MTAGLKTIIYPVKDITRAKALFSALLEVEPYADEPYYVGFKDAGQDIGLDPNGHAKGMTGPVPYWHVSDIRGGSPHWWTLVPRCCRTCRTSAAGG